MNTTESPTATDSPTATGPTPNARWRRRFTVDGVVCLVLAALSIAGAVYIWRNWPHDGATGVQLFLAGAICVSAVRDFWEGQEPPADDQPAPYVWCVDEAGPLMAERGPVDEPDLARIRLAITDPGVLIEQRRPDALRGNESLTHWQARAVLTDHGALNADPAQVRLAITDPGLFVDRRPFDAERGLESRTQWQARAVFAVLTGYKARD